MVPPASKHADAKAKQRLCVLRTNALFRRLTEGFTARVGKPVIIRVVFRRIAGVLRSEVAFQCAANAADGFSTE